MIYKITRQQDVPSWLDLHVQRHAQDAYHWITQNTGRNWLLDAIKSIGTGDRRGAWSERLTLLRLLHWTGVVALTFVIGYLRAGWRTAVDRRRARCSPSGSAGSGTSRWSRCRS